LHSKEDMKIQDLSIAQETRKLLQRDFPLTRDQKTNIRREAIKRYVETHHAGEEIPTRDLIEAAGYGSTNVEYQRGQNFLHQLVKTKRLLKNREVGRAHASYCWNYDWQRKPRAKKEEHGVIDLNGIDLSNEDDFELAIDDDNHEEFVPTADYNLDEPSAEDVKSDGIISLDTSGQKYNFTITITKRGDEDYANHKIGEIDMNNVSKPVMSYMIQEMISNLEG